MDYGRAELAERLAAEYVAGTLRGRARRRFESLLPAHARLRGEVAAWQARLAPLTEAVEPVAPPAALWQHIEARLDGRPAARPRWWERLAVWRTLSGVATAAAVALVAVLATPDAARPPIVVVLSPAAAPEAAAALPATFVASISADGRAMVTRPLTRVSVQADRALELWAVPPSGAPRSLGLISAERATVVQKGRVLVDTAAFALSLEPPGGSPTGAPTGPILYVGKLAI